MYASFLFLVLNIKAQDRVNVLIPFTVTAPTLDGVVDALWDMVPAETIEKAFRLEQPTVSAYWKALWDNDALYVLVAVEDDDHWPSWVSGGNWYEYDQPEVYLDINEVLKDGAGPGGKGNGHYQTLSSFSSGGAGIPTVLTASNYRPGGTFCYALTGENYIIEYALDYTSFVNKDGVTMSSAAFQALDSIGFDVTIIDQDEGITTVRQRAVWQNVGDIDESYVNMDDAGTITLVNSLPSKVNSQKMASLSVYPNPVTDVMVINAKFDQLIVTDILGSEVSSMETSEKNINMEWLPSGIYIIQVFNGKNLVGIAKFLKN